MTKNTIPTAFQNISALKVIDVVVNVGVGGIAFCGSIGHVLKLAREHGQDGLSAYVVAGTVEILAAYAGLEARRRKGWSRIIPIFFLLCAIAFIMWANYMSTNDKSGTGIALALAAPCIFLAVAVMAETRHWKRPTRRKVASQPQKRAESKPKPVDNKRTERETVRDEWFVRKTSPEPMTDSEIAQRLGIKVKSAADARRKWEKSLTVAE